MSDENEVELYLDFSGWVRLSHDTRMQYIGVDESKPEIITVLEWSKLSDDEQGSYMLRQSKFTTFVVSAAEVLLVCMG